MDEEGPASTPTRFDQAILEALHAHRAYDRRGAEAEEPEDGQGRAWDPTERGFAEAVHEALKWRAAARAAEGWAR